MQQKKTTSNFVVEDVTSVKGEQHYPLFKFTQNVKMRHYFQPFQIQKHTYNTTNESETTIPAIGHPQIYGSPPSSTRRLS